MKTASLWGPPPSRFYSFLRVVSGRFGAGARLAILGCADGKFVLPAVRSGFSVMASDMDGVALYGGSKPGPGGEPVWMPGLVARLKAEGLQDAVEVRHGDFTTGSPDQFDAVFTSGAIQYSANSGRSAEQLMQTVLAYVGPKGFLYADYMLPFEEKYRGRANCPDAGWWRAWASTQEDWRVRFNRVQAPTRDFPHVEMPAEHWHQWGHLLMERK